MYSEPFPCHELTWKSLFKGLYATFKACLLLVIRCARSRKHGRSQRVLIQRLIDSRLLKWKICYPACDISFTYFPWSQYFQEVTSSYYPLPSHQVPIHRRMLHNTRGQWLSYLPPVSNLSLKHLFRGAMPHLKHPGSRCFQSFPNAPIQSRVKERRRDMYENGLSFLEESAWMCFHKDSGCSSGDLQSDLHFPDFPRSDKREQ